MLVVLAVGRMGLCLKIRCRVWRESRMNSVSCRFRMVCSRLRSTVLCVWLLRRRSAQRFRRAGSFIRKGCRLRLLSALRLAPSPEPMSCLKRIFATVWVAAFPQHPRFLRDQTLTR